VQAGSLIVVDLDPDGTWSLSAAVVVLRSSGVAYAHQCAGHHCEERLAEGYLVPLGGMLLDPDQRLDPLSLTAPFHTGDKCNWGTDRTGVDRLAGLVAGLPFWTRRPEGKVSRDGLALDRSRDGEVAEGWAPVLTPDGPGVLLWTNCD